MAGDLSARLFREPTDEERNKIAAIAQAGRQGPARFGRPGQRDHLDGVGAAGSGAAAGFAEAVDPAEYPYYGEAESSRR